MVPHFHPAISPRFGGHRLYQPHRPFFGSTAPATLKNPLKDAFDKLQENPPLEIGMGQINTFTIEHLASAYQFTKTKEGYTVEIRRFLGDPYPIERYSFDAQGNPLTAEKLVPTTHYRPMRRLATNHETTVPIELPTKETVSSWTALISEGNICELKTDWQ